VHEHDVVDHAVGLEHVAVAVAVALVLDVVVGHGKSGCAVASAATASIGSWPGPSGLSGWPCMSWIAPASYTPCSFLKQRLAP
jgi:hypothetical protein